MNRKSLLSLAAWLLGIQLAAAQGTAFTYQGRLNDGTNPANGHYDFQFQVFDAPSFGSSYGSPNPNTATFVPVSNGLFSVTLDFGTGVFTGPDRWLQISARTNGIGGFSTLSPRQKLTPSPYAIYAGNSAQVGGQSVGAFVAKAGDTMTGTLNLPANGLVVGTSQLVASGLNVGIGTASPSAQLHVSSSGGDSTPQEWLNQQNSGDYSRLRFTVGGSYPNRWDVGATATVFDIYSGNFGRDFLNLSASGVSVGNNLLIASGGVRLNDANIWLRNDNNHGLGWFGTGGPNKPFAGASPDGPVLFGYSGGALGTEQSGTEKIALSWDANGNVTATNGPIKALGGLVIENRTNDPAGPLTGQMWLRTDLP